MSMTVTGEEAIMITTVTIEKERDAKNAVEEKNAEDAKSGKGARNAEEKTNATGIADNIALLALSINRQP